MAAACLAFSGLFMAAHGADSPGGVEARLVVAVADHMNHHPQPLKQEDLSETPSMRIAGITPLHGAAEVYVLIDDAANYDFGSKLQELRSFVNAQPASTAVGLAFIKDGELSVAQAPVKDHQSLARALREPSGSKPGNPWCALSNLISSWSGNGERREVLMITSGLTGGAVACANAESAIASAQRAGVAVYAIYHPAADYDKKEWRDVDAGVVELAHVCYETGGEAYFISHSAMETVAPFLDDIAEHLANQYLLTVVFDSAPGPGFRDVYLHTASPSLELMAPARVWVGDRER
jgi:hypothetical protein